MSTVTLHTFCMGPLKASSTITAWVLGRAGLYTQLERQFPQDSEIGRVRDSGDGGESASVCSLQHRLTARLGHTDRTKHVLFARLDEERKGRSSYQHLRAEQVQQWRKHDGQVVRSALSCNVARRTTGLRCPSAGPIMYDRGIFDFVRLKQLPVRFWHCHRSISCPCYCAIDATLTLSLERSRSYVPQKSLKSPSLCHYSSNRSSRPISTGYSLVLPPLQL
jgi:hypothetical protein